MSEFAILTNRKRALIALIHSVVFLGIAAHGFAAPKAGLVHRIVTADVVLVAIYLIVASILGWLVGISRCAVERLYFAFCVSSATFGLLRTILGDAAIPAAQYLRVVMLTAAVALGTWILHGFSRPAAENALPE
ncbi:MAG TPA: hypothetical protein VMG31_14225 [Verrucomicrobiae bacterium]|nr:hypothetical protein [Verrucomicrobiae bacterium]